MNTKLTIRMEDSIIERAKQYAKKHNVSLSKIIESYLNSLTQQKKGENEITPLVKKLSGVIDLPDDFDYKKEYSDYLMEKYK
ncbi:MAG: hypothetical protein GXO86_09590 [Chlorobi bacterium]|nr:hypothetical protein [Chlorobiota bacterium]